MEHSGIIPYSPEWFKLRLGTFTGSEIYKLMCSGRGKSPLQRFEDCKNNIAELQSKYASPEKLGLKSNIKLKEKIEHIRKEYLILDEKKNDLHISDTAETYILEKVHEKLTGIVKSGVDNFATQWGVEYEPLAKKWYSKLTGNNLQEPFMQFHPSIEGFSCTPDALGDLVPLAEFKCPANGANHLKHWLISDDRYFLENHPDKYWQCTSQMTIFEKDELDFVSFDPRIDSNRGMMIYNLKLNEDHKILLEDRVKATRVLYNDYLKLFTPEPIAA